MAFQIHPSEAADSASPGLEVEHLPAESLKPYPRNARTHSRKQIRQIADSIKEFGFTNPVLIDRDNQIVAGHGRVEAAKLLGLRTVPAIRLEHLNEAQKRAYIIADNRIAELAGWDTEILTSELHLLTELDLGFDVEITGFETGEIDVLIESLGEPDKPDEADQVPEVGENYQPVSKVGDLWRLGRHRLLCGDATRADTFKRLTRGRKAQMVFTDPPYNVPIDGHVSGLGAVTHREFPMASGEMDEAAFTHFLTSVLGHLADHSAEGSIHFICMDWRHMAELLDAGRAVYAELKNLCVWNKTNAGMGTFYRSKHELVFVFKKGTAPHINTFELGQHGRHRSNVWDYSGANTFKADRQSELAMHPTVKPVQLVADAILDCSKRKDIVLDCFAGSGTTLIAAERTGRCAYAMELDPVYVDTVIRRWQDFTGDQAQHANTGETFDEIAKCRTSAAPKQSGTPSAVPDGTTIDSSSNGGHYHV